MDRIFLSSDGDGSAGEGGPGQKNLSSVHTSGSFVKNVTGTNSMLSVDCSPYFERPATTTVPRIEDSTEAHNRKEKKKDPKRYHPAQSYPPKTVSEAWNPLPPDIDYESSPGVAEALLAIRRGAGIVFVSGRAGTGKSRLVSYLSDRSRTQMVVAPTGVAAMSLGGTTIHRLFRLPLGVIDITSLEPQKAWSGALRKMKRLVIDEISMVRAALLDGIDKRLREIKKSTAPFGGVQIVMVGDFLQLPPVVSGGDMALLSRPGYENPYAFSAKVLSGLSISVATLKKVWRQSDVEMIEALASIREGRRVNETISWLNSRCVGDHRSGRLPLLLMSRRDAAERYNAAGIAALAASGAKSLVFRGVISGDFGAGVKNLPVPEVLSLYEGARVMAIRNDPEGKYFNGSLGFVTGFGILDGEPCVNVVFDNDEPEGGAGEKNDVASSCISIGMAKWTRSRQKWSDSEERIIEEPVGTYSQIPLAIGYAITIHKAQGLSLDDVRIDLGKGAFAPGQLYVALSRARTVEGLSLSSSINYRDVKTDQMLISFLDWARKSENIVFEKGVPSFGPGS